MAQNNKVQMKLESVTEEKFLMSPSSLNDNIDAKKVQLGFLNQVFPDIENDKMVINFGARYVYKDEVVLESIYKYTFSVEDLKKYVSFHEDNGVTVDHIMPHFLSVAVGTMRGILVVRTAGTVFSKYPIPMIDIAQLTDSLSTK